MASHPAVRLAVFDLEGTIFRTEARLSDGSIGGSAWTLLADRLGPEALAEDRAMKARWKAGEIAGYSHWVLETIRIHVRHGLTQRLFDQVVGSVPYFAGVGETFEELRGAGVEIAVVSGGLKALADRVAVEHRVHHCFAAAEYFWGTHGELARWNVLPTDFANKRRIVELLCEDVGVGPGECAFIGDGENDATVARFVGTSIAFNPHAGLKESCTHAIEQGRGEEDLRAVVPLLIGKG
jgi:phosphoserine phosphatase